MEQISKLAGSTTDLAEVSIDYRKRTAEIVGVPKQNVFNTLWAATIEWGVLLAKIFCSAAGIVTVVAFIGGLTIDAYIATLYLKLYAGSVLGLVMLHLHPGFDRASKKWFAVKSGDVPRNKLVVSDIGSTEFVIPDVDNRVCEFEATGDIGRQLSNIQIRNEHHSTEIMRQARIKTMNYINKSGSRWNIHFMFDNVPVDGELRVEWG